MSERHAEKEAEYNRWVTARILKRVGISRHYFPNAAYFLLNRRKQALRTMGVGLQLVWSC